VPATSRCRPPSSTSSARAPDVSKTRGVWGRAAERIEHYRNSFDISDPCGWAKDL